MGSIGFCRIVNIKQVFMVILKQTNEIDNNIIFSENDLFSRKPFWESLANLILNSWNESLVISVNAEWWEWKTHFLKMWKNFLETEKNTNEKPLNIIYFDSFKNDFIEDPFLPLLSEILGYKKAELSIFESVKDKSINVIKSILPLTWKIWARFILWWDLKGVESELEKAFEWDIVEFLWKTLDSFVKKEESIKIFKESIEKIVEKQWQLIFIIDELDRCRPDFALRLLERIKHFFDIKWLYFVLWVNKAQIIHYIRKIYWNIDWNKYLQKFIDIETILPKNLSEIDNDYEKYVNKLIDNDYMEIFNSLQTKKSIKTLICSLAIHYKISFRELEKIINYLVLFYKSLPSDKHLNMYFLVIILIFVKVEDFWVYKNIKDWDNVKDSILTQLRMSWIKKPYNEHIFDQLSYVFDDTITDDLKNKFTYLNSYNFDSRKDLLKYHLDILDSFSI